MVSCCKTLRFAPFPYKFAFFKQLGLIRLTWKNLKPELGAIMKAVLLALVITVVLSSGVAHAYGEKGVHLSQRQPDHERCRV